MVETNSALNLIRTHAALLLPACAVGAVTAFSMRAQTQNQTLVQPQPPAAQVAQPPVRPLPALTPALARAVIFLDPAHGGSETGASLGNNIAEKDVTVAFAQRLRAALGSVDFAVIATRDGDLPTPLPTDQRAEAANRVHALACVVIHATATGSGVHLYTSTLLPAPSLDNPSGDAATPFTPIPWESAQAGFVEQSRRLSDLLKATFAKSGLPVLTGVAPLRPLDNLMCPAVAIEIAPNSASVSASDSTYQQQLVVAVASALQLWRTQNTPQAGGVQ